MGIRKMSKTSLYISFAILLTLCVVNLNANPKPKADDGIDIIINRVGPRMGPRIMGLRKPAWKKAQWAPMPQNLGPESTGARWIPVAPPNYEIHSNAYNGDWDNYYY